MMGWQIKNLDNTIVITPTCAADLLKVAPWMWGEYYGSYPVEGMNEDGLQEDSVLYFDEDHNEHMDFLHDDKILKVLKKHKVNGEATFMSAEGDNEGQAWGHRFENGKHIPLAGVISYTFVPA